MEAILSCEGLHKAYQTQAETVRALNGVDLAVRPGEFVAVMGPSGSGKSTLLNLLAGLDRPSEGLIRLEGQDLGRLSDRNLTLLRRRRIGFVFQFFNLVPTLTAEENILLPMLLDGRRVDQALLGRLLADLGLAERARHKPDQLSGGQQQRVAIARALVTEPALILADEPTGNLDSQSAEDILRMLRHACDERGRAIVMVTHDPKAAGFADRVITLRDGKVVSEVEMGGKGHARTNLARVAESL
jgi:putative ABC transport system ATP-binding protein